MRTTSLLALLVVVALPVAAATVTITPPAPNAASSITATAEIQAICLKPAQVTVTGNVVRAVQESRDPCTIPATPWFVPSVVAIGSLPPGHYTYELYAFGLEAPVATTTFTVAAGGTAAQVPVVDSYGLAFLAAIFVLAGAIAVGRAA